MLWLWYMACMEAEMTALLTPAELTVLFLGVVVSLGTALVWMVWELEHGKQPAKAGRNGSGLR